MKTGTYLQRLHTSHDMRSLDDVSLVAAAKAGIEPALIELLSRYTPMVFRVAYRVTRNQEDAEDVKQETLLRAFLHIRQFDGKAKFSTWLTRIAINSSLMLLRKRRRHVDVVRSLDSDVDSSRTWEIVDESVDIEGSYIKQDWCNHLRNAIQMLRPQLRRVLTIQQTDDRDLKETAQIANLTLAATKSRLLRARKALRKELTDRSRPGTSQRRIGD